MSPTPHETLRRPIAAAPADVDAPRGRRHRRAIALMLGGALFAAGNLLHPLQHDDAAYHAPTWRAAHLVIFASLPFLVLGLPVLQRRLVAGVGGRFAAYAVAAAVVGLIGIGPSAVIEAFVAPMVGHRAMEQLESGGLGVVDATFGIAFLGGTLALAWAVHRAGLRPRWAGPALGGGALALLAVMNATSPAAGVVIIAATALYGLALAALGATVARERAAT